MTLIQRALRTLREEGLHATWRRIAGRVWGTHLSYGFLYEIRPADGAPLVGRLRFRAIAENDLADLFDDWARREEKRLVDERLELLASGVGRTRVGLSAEGHPCFMLWMAGAEENAALRRTFGPAYPRLQPGEAVIDGLYVPKRFRGRNLAPGALRAIAAELHARGVRRVIAFSHHSRPAALFALRQAGFVPYCVKVDARRFFARHVRFQPLSPHHPPGKLDAIIRFALFAGSVKHTASPT